ncbi:hypothetical protein SALBM311S_02292 [Streptomyces alboniger]
MPSSQAPHKETQRPGMLRRAVGRAVKAPPAQDRYARLREIESLDPVKDCQRVCWLHTEDFKAAAAFQVTGGLYITYAAPRMAGSSISPANWRTGSSSGSSTRSSSTRRRSNTGTARAQAATLFGA